MNSTDYQQKITHITQQHLNLVAAETREAFAEACPAAVPALQIYDSMQNQYGLDGMHRLTIFLVSLFSGERDNSGFTVTQEEYELLGWLVTSFDQQLPNSGELRRLYDALSKAGGDPA